MFPSDSIRVVVISKYFQLLVDARCFHETIQNVQYAMDIPYLKMKLSFCRLCIKDQGLSNSLLLCNSLS